MDHREYRDSASSPTENHAPQSPRYVAGVDIGGTNLRVALAANPRIIQVAMRMQAVTDRSN